MRERKIKTASKIQCTINIGFQEDGSQYKPTTDTCCVKIFYLGEEIVGDFSLEVNESKFILRCSLIPLKEHQIHFLDKRGKTTRSMNFISSGEVTIS
jgi:hypothetical protein